MNFLFFDTETNGLPRDYKASYEDVDNWPRVISMGWILADQHGATLSEQYYMVKPDGWIIPKEKFWLDNGYSTEKNMAAGIAMAEILDEFMKAKLNADNLVAHNLNFDHRIVWAEFIRAGLEPKRGMNKICTMISSTKYCAIPAKFGFKWPKLEELHRKLFGCEFDGAHNALADVQTTKKCFFELLRLGVIKMPVDA